MSIINEMSIVQDKNGVKKILNPDSKYCKSGEIFYINRNDNTVTCVLYGCGDSAVNLVDKYSRQVLAGYYEDLCINYSYVGIAKCAPEDEFDEEYGMRLARYRANRKREGDVKTAVRKFAKKLRILADLIETKSQNIANPPTNE